MSKRAVVGLSILGVVAVVAAVGALARQDKRPSSPSAEDRAAHVQAAPAAAPSAPATATAAAPSTPTAPTAGTDEAPHAPAPPTLPSLPRGTSAAFAQAQRQPVTGRAAGALLADASSMNRLRDLAETNPSLSLQLAREGNARAPNSPDAPERSSIAVKSLVKMGQLQEAQAETRIMIAKFPNDPRALDLQRQLLTSPP